MSRRSPSPLTSWALAAAALAFAVFGGSLVHSDIDSGVFTGRGGSVARADHPVLFWFRIATSVGGVAMFGGLGVGLVVGVVWNWRASLMLRRTVTNLPPPTSQVRRYDE